MRRNRLRAWPAGLRWLLVIGVALAPLAGVALRPDPLWVPGLYDGGDADELVLAATRADGVAPLLAPPPLPRPDPVAAVTLPPTRTGSPAPPRAARSRAPPRV